MPVSWCYMGFRNVASGTAESTHWDCAFMTSQNSSNHQAPTIVTRFYFTLRVIKKTKSYLIPPLKQSPWCYFAIPFVSFSLGSESGNSPDLTQQSFSHHSPKTVCVRPLWSLADSGARRCPYLGLPCQQGGPRERRGGRRKHAGWLSMAGKNGLRQKRACACLMGKAISATCLLTYQCNTLSI